jgi:hypothetical protein
MNNLGLNYCCNGCAEDIVRLLVHYDNLKLTITNDPETIHKCEIEDGKLGGKCGNHNTYIINIEEQ